MTEECCANCKWLYVKDFSTGICENPNNNQKVVFPKNVCEDWEEKE
jgi:hypothetical protein